MSRGLGIMIVALIFLCHVPAMSQDDFEVAVTNALARRSRLVDPMFTTWNLAQPLRMNCHQTFKTCCAMAACQIRSSFLFPGQKRMLLI